MATRNSIEHVMAALDLSGAGSSDFDLNPDLPTRPDVELRDAAVLVPLVSTSRGLEVILTKRASHLKHHPGQIAFPGGKRDAEDVSLVATALREANEEIGLPMGAVDIVGQLPAHRTVTNFDMTPIIGSITGEIDLVPSEGEVSEIFYVPLSYLADMSKYQVQSRRWRGVWRSYYAVPFGPYYIWGATARVLYGLADRMSRCG